MAASTVRHVDLNGRVTTIVGKPESPGYADGPGAHARLANGAGFAAGSAADIFFADPGNHRVRHLKRRTACDDDNPCTIDRCGAKGCEREPIPGCKKP